MKNYLIYLFNEYFFSYKIAFLLMNINIRYTFHYKMSFN